MNSFEDFSIEDITACGSNDFGSGLRTRLYYAPDTFFKRIDLPGVTQKYQEKLLISSDFIEFQTEDCGWAFVDILIDENELKTMIPGPAQRKKTKASLEVFILGFRSRVLGFLEEHMNTPMVFCIPSIDNNSMLIGNLRNRAFFDQGNGSSGRKYEDNSGVAATINSNSPVYFFDENLIILPIDSEPGGISGSGGGFIDLTQDF